MSTVSRNGHPFSTLSIDDYQDVFRQMYDNRYFTNHGPLAKQFESRLEAFLRVDNVVTVGNESLALLIALAGLNLSGTVMIPAYAGDAALQACDWLGLRTSFCDVNVETHQPTIQKIALLPETQAVCLIETWGNRCDPAVIDWLTDQGIRVVIVAFDSFGSESNGRYVNERSEVVTVFGFGPQQILTTSQGGAIATSDDELAERFRNIRSSYGTRHKVDVKATCNGRFSEFQAGVGLKSLSYLDLALHRNRLLVQTYQTSLAKTDGIDLYSFAFTDSCNGQYFPVMVRSDFPPSRDELHAQLADMRISADKGRPATSNLPGATAVADQVLLLPVNNDIDVDLADQIATKIDSIA